MVGIYSLTSPSGKVYIGQSWNIKERMRFYRRKNCQQQTGIYRSLEKYGFDAHLTATLYFLPEDVSQKTLDDYEIFFINQHKEAGAALLNMKGGGTGGRMSEEAIKKIKIKRALQKPPTLGYKHSVETKMKIGMGNKGKVVSAEVVERMSQARKGKKPTEQAKINMRIGQAKAKTWSGRKHSAGSRQKQSLAKIGNKINNKPVKRLDTGQVFPSVTDAANSIGISMKTLSARMRTGCKKEPFFADV